MTKTTVILAACGALLCAGAALALSVHADGAVSTVQLHGD